MTEYKLKTGRLGEKIVNTYKGIEDRFVDTFLEEDGSLKTGGMAEKVTSAYQRIEDAVVGGYKKVEDTFVDAFLEKAENVEAAPRTDAAPEKKTDAKDMEKKQDLWNQ